MKSDAPETVTFTGERTPPPQAFFPANASGDDIEVYTTESRDGQGLPRHRHLLHIQCLRCIHTPFVLNPPTSVSSRYRVFSPSIRASPNPFPLRPRCWCGAGPRPPNHPPFPPPRGAPAAEVAATLHGQAADFGSMPVRFTSQKQVFLPECCWAFAPTLTVLFSRVFYFPVRVFILSKFGTIHFFVHFPFVLEIRCISQPCASGLRQQGLPDNNEDGPHGGALRYPHCPHYCFSPSLFVLF